ncbi:unnamed protein product [Prorocentrum cordatum]|uniref:CAAX prenyl protease 1 N-terminal domain-containing protein n=1 Tax=Prorocentrum cordatum TaxID=2364126 RepID=A0ABN9XCE5_9DINO|nr:unnamed protein product [Polarella glacialis]
MPESPGAAAAGPGAAGPDLETQSLARGPAQQGSYGAAAVAGAVGAPGKWPPAAPLLLGRFPVRPEAVFGAIVGVYAVVFAVNMLADLVYLGSVDARLPPGLAGDYPEAERLQSVRYTRRTLGLSLLHRAARFSAVMAFVLCGAFSGVDAGLRASGQRLAAFYEDHWLCAPLRALAGWLAGALDLCGRRCCCCCCGCGAARRCLERHSASELLLGSVYLSLFTACLFLVSAPFQYWGQSIDLEFGFANPLTVTDASFRRSFVAGLKQALVLGIPGRFFYLALLQFRYGWLGMWAATVAVSIVVQYNFSLIAPAVVGMRNPFPNNVFAVGRGFPLASTSDGARPLYR